MSFAPPSPICHLSYLTPPTLPPSLLSDSPPILQAEVVIFHPMVLRSTYTCNRRSSLQCNPPIALLYVRASSTRHPWIWLRGTVMLFATLFATEAPSIRLKGENCSNNSTPPTLNPSERQPTKVFSFIFSPMANNPRQCTKVRNLSTNLNGSTGIPCSL